MARTSGAVAKYLLFFRRETVEYDVNTLNAAISYYGSCAVAIPKRGAVAQTSPKVSAPLSLAIHAHAQESPHHPRTQIRESHRTVESHKWKVGWQVVVF